MRPVEKLETGLGTCNLPEDSAGRLLLYREGSDHSVGSIVKSITSAQDVGNGSQKQNDQQ
jgi:hypothetical protein